MDERFQFRRKGFALVDREAVIHGGPFLGEQLAQRREEFPRHGPRGGAGLPARQELGELIEQFALGKRRPLPTSPVRESETNEISTEAGQRYEFNFAAGLVCSRIMIFQTGSKEC